MGQLYRHVTTGGTPPRGTADILSIAACNRGDATVAVRLEPPSPNHSGIYHFDQDDATVIVARGWGTLEP